MTSNLDELVSKNPDLVIVNVFKERSIYYVDVFEYIYNLMADPYCILVPTSSPFQSFEYLIA